MGRPRKAKGEGRTERLAGLRLTPAERAYADELAARTGCDLSELQRRSLLRLPIPPPRDGGELAAFIVALDRVGNNLNQIARHQHTTGAVAADALDVLAEVKAIVSRVAESTA